MSARREKRLRKLEARVTYLESRTYSVEKRQLDLEELAAHPTMILRTDSEEPHPRGILASLLLKLRGGREEATSPSLEYIKSHPPKPFR